MTTTFSIIAPTYNRSEIVRATLDHLLRVDYPHDAFEIIIVDNSTDATPDMVEQVARTAPAEVRLVRSKHRLPAVKRNEGLRLASGDIALFMNDDLWVAPSFLREHAATHAAHHDPIAVLGHVDQSEKMPDQPFINWYRPFAYHLLAGQADADVDFWFSWSMNLSFPRREMLDRDLVFHEDWAEIGHEDVELGYRWTQAGGRIIYNPRAWGEHFHPHGLMSACRLQESIGRGLRDLEQLIPEPDLHVRYGVFRWSSPRRAIARGLVRRALFNRVTVPPLARWLDRHDPDASWARWAYWKVLLHYTNRGYRAGSSRDVRPVPTRPPLERVDGSDEGQRV